MLTISAIRSKYTGLLHRFIVGLMHDETEAHAIVEICFLYFEKHVSSLKTERDACIFLEAGARKLSLDYLKKINA